MTKGTKIFRITICVLLALNILWSGFWGAGFISYAKNMILTNEYGIWVKGVSVTTANQDDILGDGKVSYNSARNTLIFDNAFIEADSAIVQSEIDLRIKLIGENKFLCKDSEYIPAIYAADYYHNKDLSFEGDGSLTIEFQNISSNMQGILAADLTIGSDITIITSDCENIVNGIVCDSSLIIADGATVIVHNGVATHGAAVRVRGNTMMEEGTALNISVKSGAIETCRGLSVNGDLIMGNNTTLDVSFEDESASTDECIRVTGVLDVGADATLTASAKNVPAIECFGAIKFGKGATVSASTAAEMADIFCYGAVVNYGANVNAEIESIAGERDKVVR